MRSRFEVPVLAGILGIVAGCSSGPSGERAPIETRTPASNATGGVAGIPPLPASPPSGATPVAAAPSQPLPPLAPIAGEPLHPRARWVPAAYADLPGWTADRTADLWPSLRQGCVAPPRAWIATCGEALRFTPRDDAEARAWLEKRLEVFRLEAANGDPQGLATGYFEPLVPARRKAGGAFRIPLWGLPAGHVPRKPWFTRQEIDSRPEPQAALRGREIAWVADPLEALVLQVQGSGRLQIQEPDGTERVIRLAFAGNNEQPYRSVGRWLIDQGEMRATDASWPTIKDWARRNPQRVTEMLWSNPRVVFFREEPLPDPRIGPRGAQGVPLTPGRSIAVDPASMPYGSLAWLDTTEPLSARPLQRAVMAQDTGSAIVGAVRADYFWGWADDAEAQAGRMKQALRLWVLWPRP